MWEWGRRQLTFQNFVLVGTLVSTLTLNSARWVTTINQTSEQRGRDIQQLATDVAELKNQVADLKQFNAHLNDYIEQKFPTRRELDPQFKAINDKLDEQSMLMRRMLERYAAPSLRR